MSVKNSDRHQQLKEALEVLHELKIPDRLQEVALKHLLGASSYASKEIRGSKSHSHLSANLEGAGDLRAFISSANPKGAVSEIPALLYWAKENEGQASANEKDVVELYRRAGLRPPKDVVQSFRDLCSKKYMRLETVEGERGYVRLARAGEDFVIHDLLSKGAS